MHKGRVATERRAGVAQIVGRQVVYRGWTTLHRLEIEEDGQRYTREVEDHGDAVCVLPYDPVRRTACLVRLLRGPILFAAGGDGMSLEPPAGLIEEGEAPEDAARREVLEETGYSVGDLEPLGRVWTSPGVSAERVSLFLAAISRERRAGNGGGIAAENENITVVEMPLAELAAMADEGRLYDMHVLLLMQALRLRHPSLFS